MSSPWPDVIVGVDFGTTGTAVAYALPKDDKVHQFTKWTEEARNDAKVPSMVVFQGSDVKAWGFGVQDLDIESIATSLFHKQFKPLFNSEDREESSEAERCICTFLKELRVHLEHALPNEEPLKRINWDDPTIKIKYVFSYPTMWKDHEQRRFSNIIKEAGFQAMDDQDKMTSLDEAQAAIMHFLYSSQSAREEYLPKKDERILVADVGGGTSDVSIFRVKSINGRRLDLCEEKADEGKEVGSTKIDNHFRDKLRIAVKTKFGGELQNQHNSSDQLSDDVINMHVDAAVFPIDQRTDYIFQKHSYGQRVRDGRTQRPRFPLKFTNTVISGSGAKEIEVIINRQDFFEDAFRHQCDEVWKQCKKQMDGLSKDQKVQHVVLAGGLGSSPYIVAKLSEHFKNYPQSEGARVIQVNNAQLAVSKGLVHDALFGIYESHGWVYPSHYSYGIQKNDNKDSISWFIKQGEELKVPYTKELTRHINIDQVNRNGSGTVKLKLVRTTKRPMPNTSIKNKAEKIDWARFIFDVEDISDWVMDLKPETSMLFKKTKKVAVVFKIRLARNAIALTLEHDKKEHVRSLTLLEDWHDPPRSKDKAKNKTKGSRWVRWRMEETLTTIGVGVATVGLGVAAASLVVAVKAYFQDKKGNEENGQDEDEKNDNQANQTPNSDGKQGETGGDSVAPQNANAAESAARHNSATTQSGDLSNEIVDYSHNTFTMIEYIEPSPDHNGVITPQANTQEQQWEGNIANEIAEAQIVLCSRATGSEI